MNLTTAQTHALDSTRNTLIEAGAGSGKTTVMIERFFKIMADHPTLPPHGVLVITFTTLAATELKQRVYDRLISGNHSLSPQRSEEILSMIHRLSFSTIDGFCASILRDAPLLANISPHFSVSSAESARIRISEAIDDTLLHLAKTNNSDYQHLLTPLSKSQIKQFLQSILNSQAMPLKGGSNQEKLYQNALNCCQSEVDTIITSAAISDTKAFLRISQLAHQRYVRYKQRDNVLDYQDLLAKTLQLLTHQDSLHHIQSLYPFIFVDEFQDTDHQQWLLVQRICDTFAPFSSKKLCIVGDIKQSIYGFRGASPQLFQSLLSDDYDTSETHIIHLADNFRSSPQIIQLINDLFQPLLTTAPLPIDYTPLIAHCTTQGQVNTNFLPIGSDSKDEYGRVVQWIQQQKDHGVPLDQIAILSRKRAPLSEVGALLTKQEIPFQIHGESDYFQRQHCIDIIAFSKTLLNPFDTIALSSTLISPFFQLNYDQLYVLTHSDKTLYTTLIAISNHDYPSLWNTLSSDDRMHIQSVVTQLFKWIHHAEYHSLHTTLLQFLRTTPDINTGSVSYLIDHIQQIESAVSSRTLLWQQLSELPYSQSSYTQHTDTTGVQLMTIHQSKGLEFESVAIIQCHSPFNVSVASRLITDANGICLSITPQKEGVNHLKQSLIQAITPTVISEEKRLFYVACTRAISNLLISGIMPKHELGSTPKCMADFIRAHGTLANTHYTLNGYRYDTLRISPTPLPLFDTTVPSSQTPPPPESPQSAPLGVTVPNAVITTPITLSVGDVELLLSCPKKYHQRQLLQTLLSHGQESIDAFHLSAIRKGIMHHHAFDYWVRHQCSINDAIAHTIQQLSPKKDYTKALHDQLHQTLMALRDYNTPQTMTEQPFTLNLSHPTHPLHITGRIDGVLSTPEGITIIDIKTDRITADTIHSKTRAYHQQLQLYAMAMSHYFQCDITHITGQLYFTEINQFKSVSFTNESVQEMTASLHKLLSAPLPTTPPCQNCPIYELFPQCPEQSIF